MSGARRAPTTPRPRWCTSCWAKGSRPWWPGGSDAARRRRSGGSPMATTRPGGPLRRLRILDPAVGSGAFLLGALERLSVARPRHGSAPRPDGASSGATSSAWIGTPPRCGSPSCGSGSPSSPTTGPSGPTAVQPLPNLDCLIRQGDSLFDPAGIRLRAARRSRVGRPELARAAAPGGHRHRPEKRARCSAASRRRRPGSPSDRSRRPRPGCASRSPSASRMARGADLFGEAPRPGRAGAAAAGRAAPGAAPGAGRCGGRWLASARCPGSTIGFSSPTCSRPVASISSWAIRHGFAPRRCRPSCGAGSPAGTAGGAAGGSGYANRPDLAVAFLERSLELAAPGGVVAMLVPAKIAAAGYGRGSATRSPPSTTLVTVADLTGSPHASFEATVYPLALVARKAAAPPRHRVRRVAGPRAHGAAVEPSRRRPVAPRPAAAARRARRHAPGTPEARLGRRPAISASRPAPTGCSSTLPRSSASCCAGRSGAGTSRRSARSHARRLLWTHGPDGSPLPRLPPRAAAYLAPHLARAPRASRLRRRAAVDAVPRAGSRARRIAWSGPTSRSELRAASLAGQSDTIPLNSCYVALVRSDAEADRLAAWLNSSWLRAAARAGAVPAAGGCARFTASDGRGAAAAGRACSPTPTSPPSPARPATAAECRPSSMTSLPDISISAPPTGPRCSARSVGRAADRR